MDTKRVHRVLFDKLKVRRIVRPMFTSDQRFQILKWGGLTLFALSLLPLLMHGLFFIIFFQYYLPVLVVGYAAYFSYTTFKTSRANIEGIGAMIGGLFPTKR